MSKREAVSRGGKNAIAQYYRHILITAVGCAYMQVVSAVDLSVRPKFAVGTRTTDNVLFATANEEAAFGFDNSGGLLLKAESDKWRSVLSPSFNFRRFVIGENLDAEEYGVRSQHRWAVTQALRTEFRADYVRDSTLTTELTDVGRQTNVANRTALTLQPTVYYQYSERTSFNASFSYSDIAFDSPVEVGLIDFDFKQISAGVTRIQTDKLQLFTTAFASDYKADELSTTTRTYGAQLGLTYQYSHDFEFDLIGGYVFSDITFLEQLLAIVVDPLPRFVVISRPGEASTSGPIATATFRKDFENMRSRFAYSRRVSPSSRGAQTLEDSIVFSLDREMSRYWQIGFRGAYNMRSVEVQNTGSNLGDLNRDLVTLNGYFNYQYTEEISFRGEYRFARQKNTGSERFSNSNALFISINFNGQPWSFYDIGGLP